MRLVIVVAFVFCFLAQNNAQWKTVRIGGGGNVTSIQAHTKVQNLYFITTDVGTPYRWNSTTQAWEGLFYNMPDSYWSRCAAGNITFDPSDATGNVLYATIGGTWTTGTVLKSVDRGTTWEECGVRIEVKPNNDQGYNHRLAVDPNNSNIVYVTTRPSTTGITAINGTFKSIDAGKTWTKINELCGAFVYFDVSGGVTSGVTNNIFIGCADGVYQTTNGGANFNLMAGSPANSKCAAIHNNGTMYVTHFKTVSKWNGTSWTIITPPLVSQYQAIDVNPNNSEQLIVGVSSFSPYRFDQYVSNNGGSTWTRIGLVADLTEVPWFSTQIGGGLGDFCWDPFDQNMVWFTDFINVHQTTNIWAGTNVTWKARAVGEEETVGIGNLICPPSGSNVLLSSLADVGGFDHKSLTAPPTIGMITHFPWSFSGEAGNMTGVAIQETNPNFIARVGRHAWTGPGFSGYSTDGGASYKTWTCPADAAGGRIAVSANSTTMVWVTQAGPSYRSTDLGTTWTKIASLPSEIITQNNIFSCGPIFPIAADKVNGNKFYVYTGGKIYVSTDAGVTFTSSVAGLASTYITNSQVIETTPGKEGDIWIAAYDQGLYHSTNSGAGFTKIANVQLAKSVSIGKASASAPNNPAVYVYGTINNLTNGLFRTTDNGATWEIISAPVHTGIDSYSMAADRQVYGRVFFATIGNGIMYVEDAVDTQAPTAPKLLVANSTTNTSTRLTWEASTDNVNVSSYNIYKDDVYVGNSTIRSYSVTGLTGGTTYALSVKAKDPAGNLSTASVVNVQIPNVYVAPENIALNKPSNTSSAGSLKSNGNDGNITTKCSAMTGDVPWTYIVNLNSFYNITGIEIYWTHPEWINRYKIEASKDSVTWNVVSDKMSSTYYGGPSEINNFTANGYKYIRMIVTGFGNGGFWASILEFMVYGTPAITGTVELQTNNVKVYPNPTSDYLRIETEKSNADITVLMMNGIVVYNEKAITNNSTIPVRNWIKGMYLVRIKNDNVTTVKKIVVQ